MIVFDPLFTTLEKRHKPPSMLVRDKIIGGGTFSRIRAGASVSTDTINAICNYLHCKPSDVIRYTPDPPDDK